MNINYDVIGCLQKHFKASAFNNIQCCQIPQNKVTKERKKIPKILGNVYYSKLLSIIKVYLFYLL